MSLLGNPSKKTDFFIEPRTNEVYDFIRFGSTESRFSNHFDKDGTPSERLIRAKQEVRGEGERQNKFEPPECGEFDWSIWVYDLLSILPRMISAMRKHLYSLIAIACTALTACAQFQLPGLGGGLPTTAPGADFATFSQLFGKNAAFTARSEVRVLDKHQKETISTVMDFAMLDQKLRLDIDAAATKNKDLPPGTGEMLKQMGMDQVVVIMRPDRQKVHFVFPKSQIGLNLPIEKSDLENNDKATVQTKPLGETVLDGHPCKKSRVTITSPKGDQQEITVWRATDLNDFPIQTEQKQDEDTITTRYSKIQFVRPDARKFEPAAEVQQYNGVTEFMQGMMKKALGGGLPDGS